MRTRSGINRAADADVVSEMIETFKRELKLLSSVTDHQKALIDVKNSESERGMNAAHTLRKERFQAAEGPCFS